MKIRMEPIEMIAWFTQEGLPHPLRYRLPGDHSPVIIRVDRVLYRNEEKLAGNRMLIFRCQSVIRGVERLYELKYELNTCKWFLYKM